MKKGPALVLLIGKVPLPYPVTLATLGIAMLLAELAFARSIEVPWLDLFSQFPLAPVTIMAVPYVLGVFFWAWKTYEPTLKKISRSFDVEEPHFQSVVENYIQNEVYNDINWLVACLLIGAPFVIISDLVVLNTEWVQWELLRSMFYQPLTLANVVVLEVALAFLLSISAYLVIIHSWFVMKLAKFRIRLNILEPKRSSNLELIAKFSLRSAFAYFLGISVAAILTIGPSPFFIIIEALLFMLGLILFFVPQYFLHKSIKKAKTTMLSNMSQRFKEAYDEGNDFLRILTFCTLFNEVERLKEWPFDTTILNKLLLSALIPVATWALKILGILPF